MGAGTGIRPPPYATASQKHGSGPRTGRHRRGVADSGTTPIERVALSSGTRARRHLLSMRRGTLRPQPGNSPGSSAAHQPGAKNPAARPIPDRPTGRVAYYNTNTEPGDMDSATNESSAQWANGGMVSTAHVGATAAGVEILEAGGNAVDAAVTAAFALGVCEPAASSLGGQTMMLIHLAEPNRTFALDGSSRAPDHATTDAVTRRQRRRGHTATTVPSTAATLRYALEEYGTLDRTTILTPAIRLAEEGYQTTPLQNQLTTRELKHLKAEPAGRFFLQADGTPYPAGSCFRQPVLAATLRRLADKGIRDFYSGRIAHLIHEDMVANGGLLREDDLAQVPRPIERPVLSGRFL